jgi:D-serine deaminase-like pyridoxal phosphate-dependent protein
MSPWPAAAIGDAREAIDTPALVLDLDAFEHNLKLMADAVAGSGVRLRPHAKSHKCPEIALRQLALGAVGICCQKVSEAACFVEAGVSDILITNQIVGRAKLERLARLAGRARIGVLVDDAAHVTALARLAEAHDARIDVYVEVNVGANRCGVAPGEPARVLAEMIAAQPRLRFAGLHCYQGAAQHLRQPAERAAAIVAAAAAARDTKAAIERHGIPVEIVTGAGTGTFLLERDSGVFNEIQPGSYIFMDRDYARNQRAASDLPFRHALFVATTVMSRPTPERAVVDAGLKASSVDSGMPSVWQRDDLSFVKASDEHGVLDTARPDAVAIGDRLMLVPGHCDPTVNLYDRLVCVRGQMVEEIWPIAARGAAL